MDGHLRPVLVGVDGSYASTGAIRAGRVEARRLGAPLRLVHVVPDYFPLAPVDPLTSEGLTEAGARLLAQAEAEARAEAPDLHVDTDLRRGGSATQLAAAVDDAAAAVLFVGRDEQALIDRVLLGSTAAGAAARATRPVVAVPAGWEPSGARGEVVVAVKSPAHSSELLSDAFAAAEARGARLVVLHSWKLLSAYEHILASRVRNEDLVRRSTTELESLLQDWRVGYPDVEVEIRIVHDHPVHALVEASRSADLLVLVRHGHDLPSGSLGSLGGTGRAVLRGAECPVRIVPPGGVPEVPGLVLESAGEAAK